MISASIVIYKNSESQIEKLLSCLNNILKPDSDFILIIIDNSPKNTIKRLVTNKDITYIHNPSNPGFGAAHNIAIKEAINVGSKYHFIVNPDVFFESDVIHKMVDAMENDSTIGMMMPQILNLDGSIQNLPKLLPSPFSILIRKLKIPINYYTKFINQYELREVPKDTIYNAPLLSGCFTLLNLKAIKEVGMFDDCFFMYFEDWDLSRRIHEKYKTIYYPSVSVYHGYESGANKSAKLFIVFIQSAVAYFNKWGWYFDRERKKVNNNTMAQFKA